MNQKRTVLSVSLLLTFIILANFGGACSADNPYCMKCKNGDTCDYCAKSFVDGKSCTTPSTEIQNCVSYTSSSVCRVCNFGYYKNNEGYCSLIFTPKCLVMDDNLQHCTACSNKILVNNGKCDGDIRCSIANCLICGLNGGAEFCAVCENGYSLTKNNDKTACVQQTNSTTNCMVLSPSDPSVCLMCQYNYYIASGKCSLSANYTVTWSATASKVMSLVFISVVSFIL